MILAVYDAIVVLITHPCLFLETAWHQWCRLITDQQERVTLRSKPTTLVQFQAIKISIDSGSGYQLITLTSCRKCSIFRHHSSLWNWVLIRPVHMTWNYWVGPVHFLWTVWTL